VGDMADDMVDGTTCSWCGCYFQDPEDPDVLFTHGYPVVCKDCRKGHSEKELERLGLQTATANPC
jgi:hypothetical protein